MPGRGPVRRAWPADACSVKDAVAVALLALAGVAVLAVLAVLVRGVLDAVAAGALALVACRLRGAATVRAVKVIGSASCSV